MVEAKLANNWCKNKRVKLIVHSERAIKEFIEKLFLTIKEKL
jgi:hypothetical protein